MPNDRFATAPTTFVDADGIRFACRRFGATDGVPLVFLQDLLGFSLGGFIAQVVAAEYPELVRRIILAGTGPDGVKGIRDLGQVVARGQQASPAESRLFLFFEQTESSQRAGRAFLERQARRTTDWRRASAGASRRTPRVRPGWGRSHGRCSS